VKCRFIFGAVTIEEPGNAEKTREATDTAAYSQAPHKEVRMIYIKTQEKERSLLLNFFKSNSVKTGDKMSKIHVGSPL